MLDLRKHEEKYYELTWFDGTIIHIRTPKEKIFRDVINTSESDYATQLDDIKKLVMNIINNNKEGFVMTEADYDDKFTLEMIAIFLNDFTAEMIEKLGE